MTRAGGRGISGHAGRKLEEGDRSRVFLWGGTDISNARVVMASQLREHNKKPLGCIL